MKIMFPYLGGKKKVRDSNLFCNLAIHNSLYEVFFIQPKFFFKYRDLTDRVFKDILTYRNGCTFNFWKALPPNRKLRGKDRKGYQPYVRRPSNYNLITKFINNAANVTEDADDTSTAYLALFLRKKFSELHSISDTLLENLLMDLIYSPEEIFDKFRDTNRHNRHWMNYIYGDENETGAFLTWLGNEYHFKNWKKWKIFKRLLVTLLHNMVFFSPISECYPFPYKPYIPYGSNDLCPVVNCNVLTTLTAYNVLNKSSGSQSAIKLISNKIFKGNYDFQGIYYPNRFSLPYYASEAYYKGLKHPLFDSAMNILKYDLVNLQHPTGYWISRKILNKGDTIQSTVYALNALLNISLIQKDYSTLPNIAKGLTWLFKRYLNYHSGAYLPGGVFFTGGTVVRLHLHWTSDALTTALSMKALAKYQLFFQDYVSWKIQEQ